MGQSKVRTKKNFTGHLNGKRRTQLFVEPLPAYQPADLLTDREAAPVLHATPGTLRVWRVTNAYPTLRYEKRGRSVFYQYADLLAFIESNKVGVRPKVDSTLTVAPDA